ncbi:hypothetical protein [Methanopyrus kandleri]|uniref:Uncharacterized protein n=1 Tax=Methanopyrus kandleri TaxID=2320 RepID=A0A832WRB0_9EURY|nr:hypothetical protein [Methanopyrus kandleri]HII70071.1 hypothetical protein [Methanopyrus kandleri]
MVHVVITNHVMLLAYDCAALDDAFVAASAADFVAPGGAADSPAALAKLHQ